MKNKFGSEVMKGSTGVGLFAFHVVLIASLVDCFSCLLTIAFHVVLFAFHCFPRCLLSTLSAFPVVCFLLGLDCTLHDTIRTNTGRFCIVCSGPVVAIRTSAVPWLSFFSLFNTGDHGREPTVLSSDLRRTCSSVDSLARSTPWQAL